MAAEPLEAPALALVRLLHLASPALPIGAYSYSQGLEWTVERRIVCVVNKEMSGRTIPDIEALLNGETAAAELPAV